MTWKVYRWPIAITFLLIGWTACVYPFSKYGDSWAIAPALISLPAVLILDVLIVVKQIQNRAIAVALSTVHLCVFVLLWFGSLMLISKDSL